jgi:hypothetical protein
MACTSGAANSAAAYSTSTTLAGDWYLGTLGEMMLMFTNLRQAGVGGLTFDQYWSSAEESSDRAYYISFSDGIQGSFWKNWPPHPVRAVRAF